MVLRYKYNRQKYKLWEYQVHVCTHISKVGKVDIWIRNKAVYDITHGSNIFHVLIMQRTWPKPYKPDNREAFLSLDAWLFSIIRCVATS